MKEINCCDGRGNVANQELLVSLDQFATLATRLDFLSVTPFALGSHACHVNYARKERESVNSPFFNHICLEWLAIAIEEGHLEPSQPSVGKMIGWPQRIVTTRSLWIDFIRWCQNKNVLKDQIPERWEFYKLLDHIFIRNDDKYELPPLEKCRSVFALLRVDHERA